jgi:hypothetical protein
MVKEERSMNLLNAVSNLRWIVPDSRAIRSIVPCGRLLIATLVIIVLLLTKASAFSARHNGDYLNKVTTKLQTPHMKWAKPYARGKLKALFVVPRTVAPREIVELWQRFDVEFETFTIAHSGLLSFESDAGAAPYDLAVEGTSIEEKTDEIVSKLNRDYDAFVFANASFDVLPKEAQYKILRRVADGAGLLFTYGRHTQLPIFNKPTPEDREQILSGVPLAGLDFFSAPDTLKAFGVQKVSELLAKMVECYRFQQGRIAVLNFGAGSSTYYGGHGLTPPERHSLNWHANYEYYLSLVCKALLWTVPSKQPQVVFPHNPGEYRFSREALPLNLVLRAGCLKASGFKGRLLILLRDKTNAEEFKQEVPLNLKAGDNSVSVRIPPLKAGGHFLDLIVRSDAGTEEWGSVFFQVDSKFALSEFRTEKEFYEKGEIARGSATLSISAPAKAKLRVSLTDTAGRLYHRQELPIPTGQKRCTFPCKLDGAQTIASRLHGELIVDKTVVDAKDRFVFVPRRSSNEFRSVLWGLGLNTGLGWIANQQLRQAGFNAILAHPSSDASQERVFALCDLPLVSYSYRIMGGADEKGWRKDHWVRDVVDGCFYNPELQQKAKQVVLDRIRPVISYGPTLYTLGDENYYNYKSGFSPAGQLAFREYLKKHYGTLESLNKEWGTRYADWSQVELLPRDEAIKRGLWQMVHEHMSFNESEYADYHHFLSDAIKSVDPFARVGAEGSEPGDLEKTIAGLEVWGPYADKRGNELLRSLASERRSAGFLPARRQDVGATVAQASSLHVGATVAQASSLHVGATVAQASSLHVGATLVRGNWWGGYVGSHGARAGAAILWNQLFSGAVNTSLFFAAIGSEGLFATDLSFAAYFEKMLPDLREIYGGIGQLISASDVPHDGIAVHWSQANEHAANLFSALGGPTQSQGNLLGLLDRCGFGYRYVTTRMIENGELQKGKYRMLFLACSQAISDKEAQALREFVANGGTVIADVATGIMDGHCKPLWGEGKWNGQLDDLLGITRTGELKLKQATANVTVGNVSLADFPFRLDASLASQRASTSVDGVPMFVVNKVGKGSAVFMNFPFPNPEHPQGTVFMKMLLANTGMKPSCELLNGKGYAFRRFRNGDLTLIGVVRESEIAGNATLKLSQPAYVYDVRAGKLLGKVASVSISKDGQRARLFAVLPAPTQRLTVQVNKQFRRGDVVRARLRLETGSVKPTGRIVRVKLLRPDGVEAMTYRSYLTLQGAEAEVVIPFAFNDPVGTWTLITTDVATGVSRKVSFALQ